MLTVGQYNYIRTAYRVYGKKIREIAMETGHSRNTVRKALKQEYIGYKKRTKQVFPVLGPYLSIIDNWLEQDQDKPKKQRHTATRIFRRLKTEKGYPGGETTVRRYVREAKARLGITNQRVFIPSDPAVGQEAEVDWGTTHAILDGEMVKLKFFCMRSKFSGKHFVRCYPCERQQALFDGHIQAFSFFGGIYPVLIYDNLTTAVQKILKGKKRILQESYKVFRSYYNFTSRFCNKGQGHEKGGVEGLVGYARRNYMVPVPEAKSLEDLNEKLLKDCLSYGGHRISGREQTVDELYEAEKSQLIPLPDKPYGNVESATIKADKYSTVLVDKNRYSVPTKYAYMKVQVIVHINVIEIFYAREKIAVHSRLYGNCKWSLDPSHYLDLIKQRPQAFDSARPIRQWRQDWPDSLEKLLNHFRNKSGFTKGTREFVSVLMFYKEYDPAEIESAIEEALISKVSCHRAVEQILNNRTKSLESPFKSLSGWECLPSADISVYRQLGGTI